MESWFEAFAVFIVSHLVGDYLFQTDWQAVNKRGGLGADRTSRRALLSHISTYTLAFAPALAWLGVEEDLGWTVVGLAALIGIPHMIQDDGRLLTAYVRRVKGYTGDLRTGVFVSVDQTFHVVALFLVALLAAA